MTATTPGAASPASLVKKQTGTIPSIFPHVFYKNVKWQEEYGAEGFGRERCGIDEAELVSSELANGAHAPVLDIDVPHALVPSSTPGHSHLYLDVPMKWRQYKKLLRAMAKAGVIEKGYMKASISRGHSAARVPWLKKPTS